MKKNYHYGTLEVKLIAIAYIYIERPNDPMFKKYSPEAMIGIKNLANSLKKNIKSERNKKNG